MATPTYVKSCEPSSVADWLYAFILSVMQSSSLSVHSICYACIIIRSAHPPAPSASPVSIITVITV
jgi:hypothetical protein